MATIESRGIVRTPGVLGGKPRLDGHRISVLDVIELLDIGYSIDGAAEQLGITSEEVRDASRYYRHHREEIDEMLARRYALHEELQSAGMTNENSV